MSLGRTSNPECGPTFPAWLFPPGVSTDRLPAVQCAERGQKRRSLVPPCPAGLLPLGWTQDCLLAFGAEDERLERGGGVGRGSGSGIHCQPGQLVNFVGMHLVERRCINIRSLSEYCVSRPGRGGAGGPQMPFVKEMRMASRRPWKLAAGPWAVPRVRAQNLERAEVTASSACPGFPSTRIL